MTAQRAHDTNVIPLERFRAGGEVASSSDQYGRISAAAYREFDELAEVQFDPSMFEQLSRTLISKLEASISEHVLSQAIFARKELSDPFGPVFLADLLPDEVDAGDASFLSKRAHQYEDKSDELFIDDGWDD